MTTKVEWDDECEGDDVLVVGGPAHGAWFRHRGGLPERVHIAGRDYYALDSDAHVAKRWVAVYFAWTVPVEERSEWIASAEQIAKRSVRS